jgi:hypothetical protein
MFAPCLLLRGSPQHKLPRKKKAPEHHVCSGVARRAETADVHTHERGTYARRGKPCRRGAVFGRATRLKVCRR